MSDDIHDGVPGSQPGGREGKEEAPSAGFWQMALDASIRQGRTTPFGLLQNETVDQLALQPLLSFQS